MADAAFSKKRAAFLRSVLGSSMTCERDQNRTVPYEMGLTKAATKLSNELHSATPFGRLKPSGIAVCLEQPGIGGVCQIWLPICARAGHERYAEKFIETLRGPKFVKIAALHVSEYRQWVRNRTVVHGYGG